MSYLAAAVAPARLPAVGNCTDPIDKEVNVMSAPTRVRPARRIRDTAEWTSVEDAIAAGVSLPCQVADPDLFFAETPPEVERAKALCAVCPIRDLCLATARARREPWGVWGGEWFASGEAIGRKRPRGRPPKLSTASAA